MFLVNMERIIDELIELIKIDSSSKNEGNISAVLKEKFSNLGLEVIEDNSQKVTHHGSGNLICNLKGDPSITPILFTAHMDTVPTEKAIEPQLDGDYLTTDGTTILGADNKVGIAVILEAIKIIKETEMDHGDIQFIITAGEESGLVGAKAIDESLLIAEYGYALDHTGKIGEMVTTGAHQAKVDINIETPIKQSGQISAIKIATKAIKRMSLGRLDNETTVHIVSFSGQKTDALDYDCVKITVEIKTFDQDRLIEEIETIKQIIIQLENEFDIVGIVNTKSLYSGFQHTESDDVVITATHAAKKLKLKHQYIETYDGSDANIFSSYGIPTVNLAVGYENIHSKNERYNIHYLDILTMFVLSIIEQVNKA